MPPHYPSISEDFFDPGEAPLPRFDVGDIYANTPLPALPASPATTRKAGATEQRVESSKPPALPPPAGRDKSSGPLMSELLQLQLAELSQDADGLRTADRDLVPYVDFFIYIAGDRPLAAYSREDTRLFCAACSDVPHQKGMTAQTPIARYEHAKTHGWTGLQRLATSTIENRYFTAIRRLYTWAKEAEHYTGEHPKLAIVGSKLQGTLPRDAFNDEEVRSLFGAPSFTGHQKGNKSAVGPFLHQGAIYWGYVILFLTGMRPAEIAQLDIDDVREFDGILYIDLRPFDPEKGRVAIGDMKTLKSSNAARLIPVHPILVELGLLDRARRLAELGHTRLFPDWRYRVLPDGRVKHGDMLARDWQRRKADVTQRANVTAYSGRHSMASLLDSLNLKQRDRDRVLGHSHPGVAGRYGRKGPLPPHVVEAFVAIDTPIMTWMRETLVSARDRAEADHKLLEPWLKIKPSEANK